MACFLFDKDNTTLIIPKVEEIDKVTVYVIHVKIGSVSWLVKHRYSDFVTLHDVLVTDHCVTKDILPPKKILGNRDPAFIEKRRVGLENYIRAVVSFLKETMPRVLVVFLDFHKYDILFLLQEMSSSFLSEGDVILSMSKSFQFNPLQLHAISERLKQPCPPVEIFDRCYDFSHVLDLCSQLTSAVIEGSWGTVGTSNIVPNKCAFELSVLKECRELTLVKVSVSQIYQMGSLRQTLSRLVVKDSSLQSPAAVLLCDSMHKNYSEENKWPRLIDVDFSYNMITQFDESLELMPHLQRLAANENQLSRLDGLNRAAYLTHLWLSANKISDVSSLSSQLSSHIVHLDLSQNLVSSLVGFAGLSSLQALDLGSNLVEDVTEVQHVAHLPRLSYIVLTGNPVATVVDYRIKVLEQFGRRASSICLDNEQPSQRELDTVAVVLALRIVREGGAPTFSRSGEPTFPTSPSAASTLPSP